MTLEYSLVWLAVVVILVLPWNQKYTGTWNKIKRWYNYALSGVLISLLPMVIRFYGLAATPEVAPYIPLFNTAVETVAIILGGIGVIGIIVKLLTK